VVSITAFRIWIRCDRCNCTWLEKPAAYLLRRLTGRLIAPFTRRPSLSHLTMPVEESAADAMVPWGRRAEDVAAALVPADLPQGLEATSPRTVEDLDQWLDRCEDEFGPKARVSVTVADWLDNDGLGAPVQQPVEQPAPPDRRWVPPSRPPVQGTFVERLDALHDGLVKLEAFVLKCRRQEETTARQLELPHEPQISKPREGNVLQWPPHKRRKPITSSGRVARRVASE
jgi:hypothetical protein